MSKFYSINIYSQMLSVVSNTGHILIHLAVNNPSKVDGSINLILQMKKLKQMYGKCLPKIIQPVRTRVAGLSMSLLIYCIYHVLYLSIGSLKSILTTLIHHKKKIKYIVIFS